MLSKVFLVTLCALLSLITACSSNPLAAYQPEINNAQNSFQFQATGIKNVTSAMDYNWENTGTVADINQASSMSGGNATLTMFDAAGEQVYSRNLADNGTFATATGVAGTWVIRVTLTGLSGTLNFRAQKP